MFKVIEGSKCPLCGAEIVEREKNYSCSKWSETRCPFTIWKTTFGHDISEDEMLRLASGEKIGPFELTAKDGHAFTAAIAYDRELKKMVPKFAPRPQTEE